MMWKSVETELKASHIFKLRMIHAVLCILWEGSDQFLFYLALYFNLKLISHLQFVVLYFFSIGIFLERGKRMKNLQQRLKSIFDCSIHSLK